MNQIETLNSKKVNKGIIYFPEYYFINDEKNLKNILMNANFLRKKFKVSKFIIIGYFDQDEVKKFLANDFCKNVDYEKNDKITSSHDFFENEEFDEDLDKFDFQFALVDYFNINNVQKYLGNSNFLLALDNNNKILFSTKKYFFRFLFRIMLLGIILSLVSLYIFFPSIESLILIE